MINKQIAPYKKYYLRLRFHPNGYTISFLTIIIIIIIIIIILIIMIFY